jgi:hypothetical protein
MAPLGRRAPRLSLLALTAAAHVAVFWSLRHAQPQPPPAAMRYVDVRFIARIAPPAAPAAHPAPMNHPAARALPKRTGAQIAAVLAAPADTDGQMRTDAAVDLAAAPAAGGALDIARLRRLAAEDEKTRPKSPFEKARERDVAAKEKIVADAAERGRRKDCQTGYAGFGVFAVIPLIYGTLTDDGCKWK